LYSGGVIKLGLSNLGFDWDLQRAHAHCRNNRIELEQSPLCGCFYCFTIFIPTEIMEWVHSDASAVCPVECLFADSDYSILQASGGREWLDAPRVGQELL
jgi:hypothetical protein